jgi:aspartyl-tRNA(Asn)/glutamyl-tRNA(Gln) amidotransferase subunit A
MARPGLTDLRDAIARGESRSRDAVEACLARIDAANPDLNLLLDIRRDDALKRADEIDARLARGETVGPLAGVPIAVKDNICTREGRTTCASRMLERYLSPFDAHVIERLHAAGAVIIGKANLDEFAMGSSTEHGAFGPARNPWNRDRVCGGSSGGSAASVAAGFAAAALGSDTGGSIRQPAGFCGVTGLKPSYGRVSRYGLVAFGSSLDQIGPIASDARGAALLLSVIAGHDARDSTSVDQPVPDYVAGLDESIAGLRIGVPREYMGAGLHDEIRAAVDAAIGALCGAGGGAARTDVSLPHTDACLPTYYLISSAEASGNLARFDGVHYGHRAADAESYIDVYSQSRTEGFGDEVKRRIMLGTYALSSGYYDAFYLRALKVRTRVVEDFAAAFENCDLIACPVSPQPPFELGAKADDPAAMYLADVYTLGVSLAGLPAISVPCGFTGDGLPIGLQLIAPHLEESRILRAAHAYQRLTDWHTRTP